MTPLQFDCLYAYMFMSSLIEIFAPVLIIKTQSVSEDH